jgi:hypothetical protein
LTTPTLVRNLRARIFTRAGVVEQWTMCRSPSPAGACFGIGGESSSGCTSFSIIGLVDPPVASLVARS